MTSFDVFLSYNYSDHRLAQIICREMQKRGLKVFWDAVSLRPGLPWPEALESTLRKSRAVAILIGRELGEWQRREMWFSLDRQAVEHRNGNLFPVVPVLLPGAE